MYQNAYNSPIRTYIQSPKAPGNHFYTNKVSVNEQSMNNNLREAPGVIQMLSEKIDTVFAHVKMHDKRLMDL